MGDKLPKKLGRYPVVGLLATGGMAEILLGKALGPHGFERPVVIKRVLPHLARQKNFLDMFIDEARIVAGIRHPNVVRVHELGQEADELFLVMEYLEGESAGALMRRLRTKRQQLPFALAAHVVAEACAGLHAAHELVGPDGASRQLVHRDVSPQNIFVTYAGQVSLIDFGIAHAADRQSRTATGHLKGKFGYMSPEQCMGEELDRRSDIFSLGVLLHELSTGKRLFKRKNELLVLQAICRDPIVLPSEIRVDYPEALEKVVMRALSRDRANRYATAADMRRDIVLALASTPQTELPSELLATLMCEIFASRMQDKAEMLRRIERGDDDIKLLAAEVDSEVGLPRARPEIIFDAESDSSTSAVRALDWEPGEPSAGPVAASTAPPRRTKRWRGSPLFVLSALAVMLVGGALAFFIGGPTPTGDTAAPHASSVPTSVASAKASSTIATPAAAAQVTISVATVPSGASVEVAGQPRGSTPTKFDVPVGDEAIEVVVTLPGYERVVERVVPNVGVRLQLTLPASPRVRTLPPQPAKPASSRGFRKFD